jgi:antitoxin ParD1/3/4
MSQTIPPVVPFGLPSDLAQFVQQQVATGRYQSEADVVTHGVRLLQEREKKLEELRREVLPAFEGLDRGEGIVLKDNEALRDFMDDVKKRGKERLAAKRMQQ